MAYRSIFTGDQVSEVISRMLIDNTGIILNYDSSILFPTENQLNNEMFKDTSTLNLFIDTSANIIYKWKWVITTEDDEDYPYVGYKYVPIAGGGSANNIYWEDIG